MCCLKNVGREQLEPSFPKEGRGNKATSLYTSFHFPQYSGWTWGFSLALLCCSFHVPLFLFLYLLYLLPFAGMTSSKICSIRNAVSILHVFSWVLGHSLNNPLYTLLSHKANVVVLCLTNAPQNNWSQRKLSLPWWNLKCSTPGVQSHICKEVEEAAPNQTSSLSSLLLSMSRSSQGESSDLLRWSVSPKTHLSLSHFLTKSKPHLSATLFFYIGLFLLELRCYQCKILLRLLIW